MTSITFCPRQIYIIDCKTVSFAVSFGTRSTIIYKKGIPAGIPFLCVGYFLLEEQLEDFCDVITAVHPCVSAARIHCLVVDSSVLEVLLKLERRLVEEV